MINKQSIFDLIALIGFCALIYGLSDQPRLPVPTLFDHQDKLNHFAAYGVMSVFAWRAFQHYLSSSTLLRIFSVLFCSLYGISDEWHQSFVPGREVSAADWLADTLGAAITISVLPRLLKNSPIFIRSN